MLVSGTTAAKSYIVQRHLPDGRTRRVTVGAANVLKLDAARTAAQGVLAEFYGGKDPKAARRAAKQAVALTLRRPLEEYLAARKGLRPRTRKDYRYMVESWLKPWLNTPLGEISGKMVEKRHRAIAAAVERGGRGSGGGTANAVMRALSAVYTHAADRVGELPRNPCASLKRGWYKLPRRTRLVKADDLPAFYAAVRALDSDVSRDYLTLLLFTGLRRGEASSLRWDDLDFGARLTRLPAARTKSGAKLDLPMTDIVHAMLAARRAVGREGSYVFPAHSRSGHIEEPKFGLQLVAAACGIAVSVHDLRRTFITLAESSEISPLALKALVNHSLGGDVTAGYVLMTTERLREPAQRVADRIKAACGMGGGIPDWSREAPGNLGSAATGGQGSA